MGYTLENIRNNVMTKITDYNLLNLEETELNEYIVALLIPSIAMCEFDITYDEISKELVSDNKISALEFEAICLYIVYQWISNKVSTITNFETRMGSTDYKTFSNANNLNALVSAKQDAYSMASYYANKSNNKRVIAKMVKK